jgi:hypothetical protein
LPTPRRPECVIDVSNFIEHHNSEVVVMIVSEKRISANRQNALKSTGPKTPEGKEKSRANALKHGLCASAVVPESLELIQQRSREFFDTYKPQNEVHVWMVDQAAINSIRIDRCMRIERRVRDKMSLRAELTWDDDRRMEAEVLGRSLAKDPSATVQALGSTPQGCEWMMVRWAMLAHSADTQDAWTEDQAKLAFDLLATPHPFRPGRKPGASLDFEGNVLDPANDSAAVARREIAALKERREVVADLDEVTRALTSSDLSNEGDPELRRLRRYESTLHSRLRWAIAQISIQSPYRCPDPSLRPEWAMDPEPTPKPEPKSADEIAAEGWTPAMLHPPFDLEPEECPEPGKDADIPAILSARKERQFRKDEAKRQSRRKKAEKLRA